ncbi:HipA domain-containing protein [Pseudoalteromonas sp. C12FD-1]|uniref:HipA domain-containing protein n=1 Tax=Pseudoalteromonas sp. C12FD-1 TaxID=3131979 RepID=UPI00307D5CB2
MSSGINTSSLDVFIGQSEKVAEITLAIGSENEISFTYETKWINDGFAVSPHLPLNGDFDSRAIRNYLQNLLPEGRGLEEIVSSTTISKNNTFGLIKVIGEETSGALSFQASNYAVKQSSFREVTKDELSQKLNRFKQAGEPISLWDGRTRLSVAGVQDKLNLLEIDGKLGFGEGLLCSNKIFKFETGAAPFIAVNELFTMLLARGAGLDVPNVELRTFGEMRAFVIDRFDRRVVKEQNRVLRRHVIDGCQATNLPPSYKYERQHGDEGDGIYIRDGVSFSKLFNIKTVNEQAYQAQLIRWMTFNILVRNYDAHGKNISFFVGKNGLELTPFYDLVNIEAIIEQTRIDCAKEGSQPSISRHYAMSLGDYSSQSAGNFSNEITAYMLADFAEEFNISLARMQLLMGQTVQSVLAAIDTAKSAAVENNLSTAELTHIDLCIKIINNASGKLSEQIELLPSMKAFI